MEVLSEMDGNTLHGIFQIISFVLGDLSDDRQRMK
jgi:hypothetical protein